MGLGGKMAVGVGSGGNALTAIDYEDRQEGLAASRGRAAAAAGAGLLATAGKVLFTGDGSGNFVAFDAATGKPLWHSRIGNITNAPQTYMLDGRQYVLVAVNDTLYAFALY